jgi:FkbM family methyltransferase
MFSDYGPVASFEPVFHQIVAKNVKQNPIKHPVNVYTCALSNEQKVTEIFIPSHGCQSNTHINYGGTSFHLEGDMKGMAVEVPCEILDDIYSGIPSIIKIDVEHHEMQVLEGAKETIKKHMPTILIEIHDFDNNPVAKFLEDLGYDKPEERPEAVYLYKGKY